MEVSLCGRRACRHIYLLQKIHLLVSDVITRGQAIEIHAAGIVVGVPVDGIAAGLADIIDQCFYQLTSKIINTQIDIGSFVNTEADIGRGIERIRVVLFERKAIGHTAAKLFN